MNSAFKKIAIVLTIVLGCSVKSTAIAQSLQQQVDQILSEKYQSNMPGAAALIAKDGEVIYKNAFGLANMELGAAMKTDNVFELGSITKQFTAVAILMLEEAGKLKVTDPVTKFFPDYPTDGNQITIHHLLNHTSGIKSYTAMESFQSQARTDMTPLELIAVFKNEPMDFKTGEQWLYNNSGYIILGAIIEQVSDMSYEAFIESKIFEPLGMNNSYYGSKTQLIPNRAWGYQPTESGWRNADYLSMSLPYAAGSLMSTVDDMLLWQEALNEGKLLPETRLNQAYVNSALNDGSLTNYGYGWSINEVNGTPSIEHGGGIFGYTTYGLYVPDQDVYVIVLANSNGNSPTDVAIEMGAIAIDKPYPTQASVQLTQEQMQAWVGAYEFENGVIRHITLEDGRLYSQREGSQKLPLNAVSPKEFYFEGSFTKYTFKVGEGKKEAYFEDRINKATGFETEKAPPAEKQEIQLPISVLKNYEGTYELQPGFDIKVFVEDEQLMVQATGQESAPIFASGDHQFFLKIVPGEMTFDVDADGIATGMTLNQGGQSMPATKKD